MNSLDQILNFEARGEHVFVRNHAENCEVRLCSLESANDAAVTVMSLMAVVRATPVTFLPANYWTNREVQPASAMPFPANPMRPYSEMEQDTRPETDGFMTDDPGSTSALFPNSDCDTCESEVAGA